MNRVLSRSDPIEKRQRRGAVNPCTRTAQELRAIETLGIASQCGTLAIWKCNRFEGFQTRPRASNLRVGVRVPPGAPGTSSTCAARPAVLCWGARGS